MDGLLYVAPLAWGLIIPLALTGQAIAYYSGKRAARREMQPPAPIYPWGPGRPHPGSQPAAQWPAPQATYPPPTSTPPPPTGRPIY